MHGISAGRRRIVVTGLGLVTSLGVGVNHVWEKLINGACGISKIEDAAFKDVPSKVVSRIPEGSEAGQFNLNCFSKADQRMMTRPVLIGLLAAQEALQQANWFPESSFDREQTGVAVGNCLVSTDEIITSAAHLQNKNYKKIHPYLLPRVLPNMCAGHISIKYGLQGPLHSVSTACATGLHSVGDASRFIAHGDADVMVCGGTEALICPIVMAGFARMRALSTKFNNDPLKSSRPFDKDRDGFVMGEGCGILVLESLEHAKHRGVEILGEILGYGLSGDAAHITAPSEDGSGAHRCMMATLRDAGVHPSQVGYVNAHATSTPLGDAAESCAIHRLLGDNKDLAVSSTKGATGHLQGAAGSVEAIFALLACQTGIIPPTINLEETDIPYGLNYVPKTRQNWVNTDSHGGRRIALTNSFGFGGINASMCVSNFVS